MSTKGKRQEFSCKMQADGTTACINIIGDIGFYPPTHEYFAAQVSIAISKGATNVELYICSYGGHVFDAYEMYNQILRFTGAKSCKIGAICASAATVVALACDTRIASDNTIWMIHNPSSAVEGNKNELNAALELNKKLTDNTIKLYAKVTGLSADVVKSMMDATTFMDAETALINNFITSINDGAIASIEEVVDYDSVLMLMPDALKVKMQARIDNPPIPQSPIITMKKTLMLSQLGLAATATDDAVADAVMALRDKLTLAESALNTEQEKAKKDKATMLVDTAIKEGKITSAERDTMINDATENYELVVRMLAKVRTVLKASGNVTPALDEADRANWSLETWMKSDMNGLMALKEKDPSKYSQLYEAHYGKPV